MVGRVNGQVSWDDLNCYNLEFGVVEEIYNKVYYDFDVVVVKCKFIVIEFKYKVKVVEFGVDFLYLEDYEYIGSYVDQKKNEMKFVFKSLYEMYLLKF